MQGNGDANERWRGDSGTWRLTHRRGDGLATGEGGNPPLAKAMARPPLAGGGDDMMPRLGHWAARTGRAASWSSTAALTRSRPPGNPVRLPTRGGGASAVVKERASGDRRRARASGAGRSLLVPWFPGRDPVTRRRVALGAGRHRMGTRRLSPDADEATNRIRTVSSPRHRIRSRGTTLCPASSRLARLGVRARPQGESPRGGPMAASACSSQKFMPISRYIAVAVMRCSCACGRLLARR